ncbi:lipase family protein [Planotetraspora sp. GP83]|uniref:lipase family protein n=1 Tax=Planotetraspora sp. GP83 TaxID=3156264 RepID=UPI0035110A16
MGEVPVMEWERRLRDVMAAGGLWTRDTRAPSYEELRPYGHRETSGFPVYKNLEERLLRAEDHPDPVIAHVLATCAGYAYSGADTLSMIMARMGLPDNNCRVIASTVDAMLICSTSFVIQSNSGRVAILCYRGTEPMNFVNWLTDIDLEPERMGYQFGDPCATVHAGFYRNVRTTRYEVMHTLREACNRQSVRIALPNGLYGAELPGMQNNLEALYITGHSLGGAMAAMMGVMMRHERKYRDEFADRLKAVYTFGQPMIGDPSFAEACQRDDFLREKTIRYVHDSDIVPNLPPTTSGRFKHFGREFQYQVPHVRNGLMDLLGLLGCTYNPRKGHWVAKKSPTPQMPGALGIALGAMSFISRKFQATRSLPVMYSFEDHLPHHYISALTPYGVANEFGD